MKSINVKNKQEYLLIPKSPGDYLLYNLENRRVYHGFSYHVARLLYNILPAL